MTIRVVTAEQAREIDAATIRAGTPSSALMRRAGIAAAQVLLDRFAELSRSGVTVVCGPGNNGGDGWVLAAELHRRGLPVTVICCDQPRTDDARAAQADYAGPVGDDAIGRIVVDAMLGTGTVGELRGAIDERVRYLAIARANGARVVALDLPTGVHADRGAGSHAVRADLTISFGTIKFGHLLARELCGEIVVVDIGLDAAALAELDAPELVDEALVQRAMPVLASASHKGQRGRVLILGGARGMAGAAALAAEGAFRAGAGMVRIACAPQSLSPLQAIAPQATALDWPTDQATAARACAWAHALVVGPGLGPSASAVDALRLVLESSQAPVVVDADALVPGLPTGGGPRVYTPHRAEAARLLGCSVAEVEADPQRAAASLATRPGDVVLLKGVPTCIATSDGGQYVAARGSLALAQGGSGDLLAGVIGALLAQGVPPLLAAAIGAYAHGRAGELAAENGWRGIPMSDVARALAQVWSERERRDVPDVLGVLPGIRHA